MEKETKVAAVSMKNITKTFGSVIANDKVNLDIYKGEILSLLVENGSMITIFIMLVAAISLLVGGIGVMNIMWCSVTERTREIGIRKALGNRTKSILLQFLAESASCTGIGGMIGIVIGIAGAYAVCALPMVSFGPAVSAGAIMEQLYFPAPGAGIFFGIYPARKAACLIGGLGEAPISDIVLRGHSNLQEA